MYGQHLIQPRAIYSTKQVREFDRHAIEDYGIAGFELMRRAGRAALVALRSRWSGSACLHVFCGAGNNAGDGYVVAALGVQEGFDVRVTAVVPPEQLRGDAALAHAMARDAGVMIDAFTTQTGIAGGSIVVDALLGTGLTRDVDGLMGQAVGLINASRCPVVALDVPTGLDSDTGSVRGTAVSADLTVTFVGLKAGLFLGAAPDLRGEVEFASLDIPEAVFDQQSPVMNLLDSSDYADILKPRSRIAHKGMNGCVLVVGGQAGMAGAARLAAESALRTGAGLVHAAVAPDCVAQVAAGRPEIMCHAVSDPGQLQPLVETADVIVVGPGLGRDGAGQALASAAFASGKPAVVDADALNYLAGKRSRRDDWVLTPHVAEAGRLLSLSAAAVQADRRASVLRLAREFGGFAVLKGACSLVAEVAESETVSVCDHGNPGMASGGMGDLLAGILGGLVAQFGLSRRTVELGVLIHALAGDDAAQSGERGLLASDLLPAIRRRVNPQ